MADRLEPSDNPVATALVIAYELVKSHGKNRDKSDATAAKLAVEVNEVLKTLLSGFQIAQLHGK